MSRCGDACGASRAAAGGVPRVPEDRQGDMSSVPAARLFPNVKAARNPIESQRRCHVSFFEREVRA